MDLYNIITKIPYMIMLIIGLTLVLYIYIGGLQDLSVDIDRASQQEYRQAAILENLLTIDVPSEETEISNYDSRRSILPEEIITNQAPGPDSAGFKIKDGHCFIEEIPNLDGSEFGFGVSTVDDLEANANDPKQIRCQGSPPQNSAWSPALIERENNPPVEVILYVYKI